MNDLDKQYVQRDAQRRAADPGHSTRYSEAVNRYLGVAGYGAAEPIRKAPATVPAAVEPAVRAGVVVVAVDETPASCTAVDHAAIEAELRGWDLRIVHVRRSGGRHPTARDTGAGLLERLTDRVHACSPSVAVTSHLAVGSAAQLVLREARDADLVVVGHRHGAAGTAFGMSVGDRVAAQYAGPVLVVRMPGWPPGPGFGRRPIVVGADRQERTPATAFALEEARARGCDLVVVHTGAEVAPAAWVETVDGVLVHYRVVRSDPATALIDQSNRAAALVVGRRGTGGSPVALLGSVSRTLVQHAYCPVFLVD
jgi:nucleotide-binding universal stress UspA family protein